ncbi:MAG: hypothetical protein HIU82_15815 [Proteobacteria bacterium]|nr:hypothetical protein [Pseudomonadota bacterium]
MSDVLPVPIEELKRVAAANTDLVSAARRLADLATHTADPKLADALLGTVREILTSSEAISGAVRTAGYLRAARRS